jgi:dephospho-CoA kinase
VFLIGLTGGIAAGKSTVAKLLVERGAHEIDADQVAREVVQKGTVGLAQVVNQFGEQVLSERGELDRAKLASIIFADEAKRLLLESILHPLIRARTVELITQSPKPIVVYSVPLLVESGVDHDFDLVVTVEAGLKQQLSRLTESRGLSLSEAKARLDSQATEADRTKRADIVIDSSGSKEQLAAQVDLLWEKITELAEKRSDLGAN